MAIYSYDDVRYVLRKAGFKKIRSRKHETWEKILPNLVVLQTRLSHKGKRDVPRGTFQEVLRQTGLSEEEFRGLLRG